jgi:hypothetical protein
VRLIAAHITNYRSVEDSETFTIEPTVTCLVGKNESGKTAVQRAIYRMNPIEPSAKFDEVVDFPARHTRQRREWGDQERIPVGTLTFELDDDEIKTIEADLGLGALRSREFTVVRGYRTDNRTYDLKVNQGAIVEHLRSLLDLPAGVAAEVTAAKSVAQLLESLDSLAEPPVAAIDLANRIRGWREHDVELYLIDEYAHPWLPKFIYFDDYDAMPGKVSIPDLIRRRDTEDLTRGEQALMSLLHLAGVDPKDFYNVDKHERLIRELENAGNVISDEVFEYWTQNTELEVELRVLEPESGAEAPLHEGPILLVRVRNKRHRVTVPFDERSRGFVWFFSFLAYFSDIETTADTDLVLLLDEPGLSLHGRAQEDLLTLIDKRIAPKHQVIYTTHSPFLVSPDHLDRVRTVIDKDKVGTKVSGEIFQADEDTAFPLLSAMGVEISQTLFVGPHTLLLEGPSDLIYLDVLSEILESKGETGLDPRWVKTPVGGAGKLSTFVTLLGANKLKVAVLVDSSTKDAGAVTRLRDNGQLAKQGLIEISEITRTADADIEDLFERAFYVDLVNAAYETELPTPIGLAGLESKDPRITRQVTAYFADNNIAGGKFNHYRPAATLLRKPTLAKKINKATQDRAKKLIERLNGLLP